MKTFKWGPKRGFGNNLHIKSIVRPDRIDRMEIHNCILSMGCYAFSDGSELSFPKKRGIANKIQHSIMQLNHYQVKSLEEFEDKIKKGRAGKKIGDSTRIRNNPEVLLKKIDIKEEFYDDIDLTFFESEIYQKIYLYK